MKQLTHKLPILALIIAIPVFCEFSFQPKDTWTWPTEPKNLKVLPKGTAGDDLKAIMQGWNKALGVKCNHCHVSKEGAPFSQWDFVADTKPEKNMARDMVKMTNSINKKFMTKKFQSKIMLSCATCHRGEKAPSM